MTALPAPLPLVGPSGSGEVHLHGAHLTSWTPAGGAPVLWTSAQARYEAGVAIRGGVPIVFPWFGAGRSGELSPAHGFARTATWRLLELGTDGDDALAVLALDSDDEHGDVFPYRFTATYEIRLGSALHLALTVESRDERVFSYEEALHTYLRVGDVRETRVRGLSGHSYLDQVAEGGPRVEVQSGDLSFTQETDRIYAASGSVTVVDPVMGRTIVVDKRHSASTVVWNPWTAKAHAMSDFGDDEWPSMLCIEGGNLRHESVWLDPGDRHEMGYSIRVEPLS